MSEVPAPVGTGHRATFLGERLHLHGQATPAIVGASALAAAVLVPLLWARLPPAALLAWSGVLLAALAASLAVRQAQRRSAERPLGAHWLQRHRLTFLLHGMAWAGLWPLLAALPGREGLDLATFVVTAVVGGSLVVGAFDLPAARLFAITAASGLLLRLAGVGGGAEIELLVVAALFTAMIVLAGQRAQEMMSSRVLGPDGSRLHAFGHATPIHDAGGRRIASIGLWAELTAQKSLELELQTYERVVNSITDPVAVVDAQLDYVLVNDAWCGMFGLARGQALGQRASGGLLGINGERQRLEAIASCLRTGTASTVTLPTAMRGGRERVLQTRYFPYRDGGREGTRVIMVTRDITEQESDRRAVEAAAEHLRRTLNATGDAIFASDATDPNMPVRFANEQMLRMWGLPPGCEATLTPAQIMAAAGALFVHPEAEVTRIRDIIAANRRDESRVHLRDGRVLSRRCEPAMLDGQPLRVWSFRDITAEENALAAMRASESELRALLGAFPGYIAASDQDGRYTFVNDRLAALMGREPRRIIGQRIRDVLDEERYQLNMSELARVRAGEVVRAERRYRLPDGVLVDVEITHVIGPRQGDGRQMSYSFGQDVSEKNRALEALTVARDEAERANRAKSQFLSQMSHELRTPMNAIMGFAHLLRRDQRAPLAEHQLGYVGHILGGAQHLLELIDDVLDLGRVEAGRMVLEPRPVDLGEVVPETLAFVRGLAREHGVRLLPPLGLEPGGRPTVLADQRRLRQVILNLLSNAIKYNRADGEVGVACRCEGPSVVIEVRDSGQGIAASERERLFLPFERLGAERGSIEGTGIGLALSRRLMLAMGGQIGVESEPGVGSTFSLRLAAPAMRAAPTATADRAAPRSPEPAPRGARTTVLYIDDNEINLLLVERLLASAGGWRLVATSNPVDGLRLAETEAPRVVLVDIHMPEMDGFDVLARLRSQPATAGLPVVAVSADAAPADLRAARAAGFADYLAKPFDFEHVLQTLTRLAQ